jgi:transposase
VIALSSGVRVYLACGVTDMRKGMVGLAMLIQQGLGPDPFDGALYAFRGRRAGLIKLLWHDGIGLCMVTKRLDHSSRPSPAQAPALHNERPAPGSGMIGRAFGNRKEAPRLVRLDDAGDAGGAGEDGARGEWWCR